jgi:cobalt-zinc-cadmium efflux system protein
VEDSSHWSGWPSGSGRCCKALERSSGGKHYEHHEHGLEDHGHAGHDHAGNASEQRLRVALALLFVFTLVEAIGGLWSHSIALLAEAAHMLADSASLLLAIIAIRVGRQPASAVRTYGSRRYQTLAAYTNGLALLALTGWFMVEAARRLFEPTQVNGKIMLGIALIGGIANLAAFVVLSGASPLNEKGARAHVLSDLLGSGAAAAAAGIILAFGWLPADPLLSILISVLIVRSGWQLTRDSAHVLLEGTPPGCDVEQIETELKTIPGVLSIHHIHAWSLTGESPIVTLHAELGEGADRPQVLTAVLSRLRERFDVEHATVQMEDGACAAPGKPDDCHEASRSTEEDHEGHNY